MQRFLAELDTEYLDLLLIHSPTVPPILGMAPDPHQQAQAPLSKGVSINQNQQTLISAYSGEMLRPSLCLKRCLNIARQRELRGETWRCLQDLHSEGVARAIGVSNYSPEHLQEVRRQSAVPAAVLQVESLGGEQPHLNQVHMTVFNSQASNSFT